MKDKSSETIPEGSRAETLEMVATVYFYVLIDPIDLLIKYVGRTVDIDSRFRGHIYEAKTNNRNKRERWIVSLLRKNKKPTMKIIYTKECMNSEAIEIEKMLIRKLRKRFPLKNGDDHALSGSISTKQVFQYSLDGDFIYSYLNCNKAMLSTGVKDCNIARCCKNENGYGTKTAGGFFWSYIQYKEYPYKYLSKWRELKGKPVIGTKDGISTIYSTARIAEKETGTNYKHISACCTGKRKSANGYYWEFS